MKKTSKKKPKPKAQKSAINVRAKSPVFITGEIVEVVETSHVTFLFKKPRKSKMTKKTVMWSDLIMVKGEEGEMGEIIYTESNHAISTGTGEFVSNEGSCVTINMDGVTVLINNNNASVECLIDKVD